MGKFKKQGKSKIQAISTASLPDIVFMLLFFFMVTTVMKQDDLKVRITPAKADQVTKLENKSLVSYIYIGKPHKAATFGTIDRIQLNDAFSEPDQIREFIAAERESMDEADQLRMTVSLKVDGETEMGIVTDVKQELRRASALKINYSTVKADPVAGRR